MGCETDGAGKRYTLPQRHPFSVRPLTAAGERSKSSREPRVTSRRGLGLGKAQQGEGDTHPAETQSVWTALLCTLPSCSKSQTPQNSLPRGLGTLPDKPERGPRQAGRADVHIHPLPGPQPQGRGPRGCTGSGHRPAAAKHLSCCPNAPQCCQDPADPPPCQPQQGKSPAQAVGSPRPSSAAQEQTPGLRCFQERAATAANEGINPT